MASSNNDIPKGSEADRIRWKNWAIQNHLADENGIFLRKIIDERRAAFLVGLDEKHQELVDFIEKVVLYIFDFRNYVVEQWPETIRRMLNRVTADAQAITPPFESWYTPLDSEKRKQATRVWTELILFLVLEYYHFNDVTRLEGGWTTQLKGSPGTLTDMGLDTYYDEGAGKAIGRVFANGLAGGECTTTAVGELLSIMIMDRSPTPCHNPIIFWVGIILQTEEFGNQSRVAFNGLEDKLSTREKLEALVHYARVLILYDACLSWLTSDSVSEEWKGALKHALSTVDKGWLNDGRPRPAAYQGDPDSINEPFWQAFIQHFDDLSQSYLMKDSRSPIGVILQLLDA